MDKGYVMNLDYIKAPTLLTPTPMHNGRVGVIAYRRRY